MNLKHLGRNAPLDSLRPTPPLTSRLRFGDRIPSFLPPAKRRLLLCDKTTGLRFSAPGGATFRSPPGIPDRGASLPGGDDPVCHGSGPPVVTFPVCLRWIRIGWVPPLHGGDEPGLPPVPAPGETTFPVCLVGFGSDDLPPLSGGRTGLPRFERPGRRRPSRFASVGLDREICLPCPEGMTPDLPPLDSGSGGASLAGDDLPACLRLTPDQVICAWNESGDDDLPPLHPE